MDSTAASLMSIDESARRRFEAAWRDGRPAEIEKFLPPLGDPRRLATLEELVHIDLEQAWKEVAQNRTDDGAAANTRPLVENYLERFPDLKHPDILLRLLQQEYAVRQLHGDRPSTEEYPKRYPDLITDATKIAGAEKKEAPLEVPGYEILGVLGRGGMGIVFRARQEGLNRIVALKLIRYGKLAGPDELARFQTEAEAVAQLQHPNIVQIYEVGTTTSGPFVSLEYVTGGSLDKLLAGNPQSPRLAARLAHDLAVAMHHAHQRGIVHRDLKPGNILLAEKPGAADDFPWLPKIADFGLAKRLENDSGQTHTGVILGTPSYMAPEQAASRKDIGPAADVYALGAILYEAITGRPPFRAANAFDTIQQVLTEDPVAPHRLQSRTPVDLATICLKCLEKDPARRYASAEALAQDLGRFLRDEPILARPVSRVERLWRWSRRNPLVAGLISALLISLIGGLVAVTILWQLAEKRREESEYAATEIRRQKNAADESSRQARKAVRESFTLATEHPYFHRDNMQPARKLLLEAAKRYFEDFVKQRHDDPELKAEMADAMQRLGVITDALASKQDALAYFNDAKNRYQELLANTPGVQSLQLELARTLRKSGTVRFALGEIEPARTDLHAALVHLEQLVSADPSDSTLQNELARTSIDLAGLQYKRDRGDEAIHALQKTRGRLLPLAEKSRKVVTYKNLSACLVMLGQALENRGRYKEAEEALKEAIPVQERIVALLDQDPGERSELARVYGSLGLVLSGQGKRKETIKAYETALDMRESLVASNPSVTSYQLDLATVRFHLAEELRESGVMPKALDMMHKSNDLFAALAKRYPEVPRFHEGMALANLSLHKLHRLRKDPIKAAEHLRSARDALDETLQREPGTLAYRFHDATWYVNAAETHRHAKEYAPSYEKYQKAKQILAELHAKDARNAEYRRDLALVLVNLAYLASLERKYEECLECYVEAYSIRRSLALDFPSSKVHQATFANADKYVESAVQLLAHHANDKRYQKDVAASREKARLFLERLTREHPRVPHLWIAVAGLTGIKK